LQAKVEWVMGDGVMGSVSIWHWVVVGVIVMLLFGRGKISDLMGDAAKGIKAFKKGMADDDAPAAAKADEVAKPIANAAASVEDVKVAAGDKSAK
jgi:sec-independent protein translocase protein TatA